MGRRQDFQRACNCGGNSRLTGHLHSYGGREEALKMKEGLQAAQKEGRSIIQQGEEKAKEVKDKATK